MDISVCVCVWGGSFLRREAAFRQILVGGGGGVERERRGCGRLSRECQPCTAAAGAASGVNGVRGSLKEDRCGSWLFTPPASFTCFQTVLLEVVKYNFLFNTGDPGQGKP